MLVIGGGPGGLEAARVLAGNGHAVTVWEASEQLGGMFVDLNRLLLPAEAPAAA